VKTTYPELCVQSVVGEAWWEEGHRELLARGRLIWAVVQYPDVKPYRLVPLGRGDEPRQHQEARYRLEEFRLTDPQPKVSGLPVAGLPLREDETFMVRRGKRRPAVVVALSGIDVDPRFKRGSASWQHRPAVLVAPYYGASQGATRGGWNQEFVNRIQQAEYCQYAWDILPLGAQTDGAILRFDHIFPIGADPANWHDTGCQMTPAAMAITDEWLSWHLTGALTDGALNVARSLLLEEH
jgi:hypothetical protein